MRNIKESFFTIDCKHLCAGNATNVSKRKGNMVLKYFLKFSGPIDVYILAGDNVINRWRALLGPTRVYKTVYSHPESIRSLYGLSDTRNVCHGSDSEESAKREIGIFFSNFNVDRWLEEHKKL